MELNSGAFIDYTSQKNISQDFSNNFLTTLLNYDQYGSRHSPLLIFLLWSIRIFKY